MADLSHCGNIVYSHDRDLFLLSLFATGKGREALLTVYALNVELAQVQDKVSEAMIGQMRLAWWQEAIESLYSGKPWRGHLVLEALLPLTAYLTKKELMLLVEQYREHFPELPHNDTLLGAISLHLINIFCPKDEPRWRKARDTIAAHRKRYGKRCNGWMSFKLLIGA